MSSVFAYQRPVTNSTSRRARNWRFMRLSPASIIRCPPIGFEAWQGVCALWGALLHNCYRVGIKFPVRSRTVKGVPQYVHSAGRRRGRMQRGYRGCDVTTVVRHWRASLTFYTTAFGFLMIDPYDLHVGAGRSFVVGVALTRCFQAFTTAAVVKNSLRSPINRSRSGNRVTSAT